MAATAVMVVMDMVAMDTDMDMVMDTDMVTGMDQIPMKL